MSGPGAPHTTESLSPRFRYGQVVPTHDVPVVLEPGYQFHRLVPLDVMLITASLRMEEYTVPGVSAAMRNWDEAVDLLMRERVDHIMLAGIPLCAQLGRSAVLEIHERTQARTGVPCDSSIEAVVVALSHLGCRRLAVGSRWSDEINAAVTRYFADADIDIVAITGRGQWAKDAYAMTLDEGMASALEVGREAATLAADAEALLVAGGAVLTLHTVPILEAETGLPVLTNLTTEVWNGLVRGGVVDPPAGYGRLLTGTAGSHLM